MGESLKDNQEEVTVEDIPSFLDSIETPTQNQEEVTVEDDVAPFLDSIETPTENQEEVTVEDVPSVNEEDFEEYEVDDLVLSPWKNRVHSRMNKRIKAMRKWQIRRMRQRIATIKRNRKLSSRRKMILIRAVKRRCIKRMALWTRALEYVYRRIATRIRRIRCFRWCWSHGHLKYYGRCGRTCRRRY